MDCFGAGVGGVVLLVLLRKALVLLLAPTLNPPGYSLMFCGLKKSHKQAHLPLLPKGSLWQSSEVGGRC